MISSSCELSIDNYSTYIAIYLTGYAVPLASIFNTLQLCCTVNRSNGGTPLHDPSQPFSPTPQHRLSPQHLHMTLSIPKSILTVWWIALLSAVIELSLHIQYQVFNYESIIEDCKQSRHPATLGGCSLLHSCCSVDSLFPAPSYHRPSVSRGSWGLRSKLPSVDRLRPPPKTWP